MECAFTIVAKNYIGLAKILQKSFLQYNCIPFYIIVADELPESLAEDSIYEAKTILDIEKEKWHEMAMKYDLTEFCTSIKPFCFKYLFRKFDKVLYLDPDILIFGSFFDVYNLLNNYSVILTPHISECHANYIGDLKENQLLGSGVFNLGFCAVKKDELSERIIEWWGNRLISMCFSDPLQYLYTDQHWMDLLPCFLGNKLLVLRNFGYNVAPWNFFERKVISDIGNNYYVVSREIDNSEKVPLVFVHYSGYDYKSVLSGEFVQKNIRGMVQYEDVVLILNAYQNVLLENREVFEKYVNMKYTYNFFNDDKGTPVLSFHRRLYNALVTNSIISHEDPFQVNSLFWKKLTSSHLIPKKNSHVDKETRNSLEGFKQKKKRVDDLLFLLFKLIGYNRYVLLIKIMRFYSRMEQHLFLMKE